MFNNLQDSLERALKTLKGQGQITEINVASTVKEIRRALLDADVNYKIAKDVTDRVKEKALGLGVLKALQPGQLFTKIVFDELCTLMGGTTSELNTNAQPAIILMAGLQGSGKTTMSGKLAKMLKSKGLRVLLTAADVYRPAAIDQLHVLGEQIGVDVYSDRESKNPVAIAQAAIKKAKDEGYKVVIVDTAGRLAIDEEMMSEIANIKTAVKPQEILFVVDAMTGQDAVNTAQAFDQRLDYTGVILSKLDGDSRGGAAISIAYTVGKPIKFIGTGEKLDAIDVFHPDRMANRILGMGDVISLVERAQQQYDEEESRKIQKKIAQNKFDFDDFLSQIKQIQKMGNIKDLMGMIPGMSAATKDLEIDNSMFTEVECIIQSMTKKERANPEIINGSRRQRIASGSGKDVTKVSQLIKQFEEMRKMMHQMNKMGYGSNKAPKKRM